MNDLYGLTVTDGAAKHSEAIPLEKGSAPCVSDWKYDYCTSFQDGKRTYRHYAVNAATGENVSLNFSGDQMVSADAFRKLALMGFPVLPDGKAWSEATVSFYYFSYQDRMERNNGIDPRILVLVPLVWIAVAACIVAAF